MAFLRAILLIALAAVLHGPARAVTFDVFLEITPSQGPAPAGDSSDAIYSGWIDVLGFEGGLDFPTTISSTGGAGAGKVTFKEFTIVKKAGAPSARLLNILGTGGSSTLKMIIAVRGPIRTEMWKMTASTCFFTKQAFVATAGDSYMQERLSFVSGKIEWSFTEVSASGDALREYFADWSVIDNTGDIGQRTPTSTGAVDRNGDGIPSDWEIFYGLDPTAANAAVDFDGDGLTTIEEYIAHTNPKKAESTFKVTGVQPAVGGTLRLTWQSVAGLSYKIFGAPSPAGPYTLVKSVTGTETGQTTTTVPSTGGQMYFYKVVTP
jgi:type VI secretion system secreted protein Hcp